MLRKFIVAATAATPAMPIAAVVRDDALIARGFDLVGMNRAVAPREDFGSVKHDPAR